jgi:hypothetical protein
MMRAFVSILTISCLMWSAVALTTSSVSAARLAAGKPYGCEINPNAANCTKPVSPAVSQGGSVTGVQAGPSSAAPSTLPASGGGAGVPAHQVPVPFFLGLALVALGFGVRRTLALRI